MSRLMPEIRGRSPTTLRTRRLAIRPLAPAMGAEVTGVDLARPVDDATFDEIVQALDRFLLLCFRGTAPADADLGPFLRRFGTPAADRVADAPGNWRTATANGNPARAALCRAEGEAPAIRFANLRIAWDTLTDAARTRLDGIRAQYRPSPGMARSEPVTRPLVRHGSGTGPAGFWLDPASLVGFVDPAGEVPADLPARLLAHATRAEFTYRHVWQANDILLWDPRQTMYEPADAPAETATPRIVVAE